MDTTTAIRVFVGTIILLVFLVIVLIPYFKIYKKAGFSGWLCILNLIPIVNLIVLYCVAFMEWPVHRENRILRKADGYIK